MSSEVEPSYRALFAVPGARSIFVSMTLSRVAQNMIALGLTLLALHLFESPAVAGAATFASVVPGLVLSPIAGALLDRHGRVRLMALDYALGATALVALAVLATRGLLTPAGLVGIAAVASLTTPFSATGPRSLLPRLVPTELWERANAADSASFVVATLTGPAVIGFAAQALGPPLSLLTAAGALAGAALSLRGLPDPRDGVETSGRLGRDALDGLRYVWRNPTLRGLAVTISLANVTWGMGTVAIPVIVLGRLGHGPGTVGMLLAVQGLGGMVAALWFGRRDSAGRERRWLGLALLGSAAVTGLLIPDAGVPLVVVALLGQGLVNGPLDVALFTIRQRRTDPAWMGRAFAVSMALNWSGMPIGAALTGWLASVASVETAIGVGIVTTLAAAASVWWLVPAE